ncbi:hypothetical protein GOBAR_AA06446 [Gossypium barbadense]|uniref:TIR domain-containing protein n=1 Tax=Gossypium barbadense TaxID=3634 RepID=A0A2P5YEV0_GOSBA|nr:hypothetical protein GOBAR_AA06446 [Gossypium barbadense]
MQARVGASQRGRQSKCKLERVQAKNGRLKASKIYLQVVYARRSRTVMNKGTRQDVLSTKAVKEEKTPFSRLKMKCLCRASLKRSILGLPSLSRSGIVTFRDDPKLEASEEITPKLFKAIHQSWCSVIVFSQTYTFSIWCLEELAEIVKQLNNDGHKVFPFFYDVDPSDLKKQKEKVEEAFSRHKERYKEDSKIFIADIREVSDKYRLVSLQKQFLSQIFHGECFNFYNVHEGSAIISHRLAHKKVLVVLDKVDNIQHLKCLVGWHDWFELGSRIVVTTREEHLLQSWLVDDVYEPTTLNPKDALELFSLKAFHSDTVLKDDFVELSKHVLNYAGGLPLALKVFGYFLCGRDATQWRSAVERLKRDSNKEILDKLRISFDGLEEREKNIFLDIACFFNRENKDFVIKVLDGCEFFPDIGIDVLIKKSPVKVDKHNKYLKMHDLLQEMGRTIVREKCIDEPGKRCRLWEERDVHHVLTLNTGIEQDAQFECGYLLEDEKIEITQSSLPIKL